VWVDGDTQRVALGWRVLPRWGAIQRPPAVGFLRATAPPRDTSPNFRSISPARPLRGLKAQSPQRINVQSDRSFFSLRFCSLTVGSPLSSCLWPLALCEFAPSGRKNPAVHYTKTIRIQRSPRSRGDLPLATISPPCRRQFDFPGFTGVFFGSLVCGIGMVGPFAGPCPSPTSSTNDS
jgi:hypothetical protein